MRHPPEDPGLESVASAISQLTRDAPATLFGEAIRQSIDEVLDGPRTGRWGFDQLEKTEKTYVGTKLEIVVRTALGLEKGSRLDLEIEGEPVDVKWAMKSAWQIPREAIGELCLCIGGLDNMTRFQVGVVRCTEGHLNTGENRDRKRTLSTIGRQAIRWLVEPTLIPPNFVAEMDADIRTKVMAQPTIQTRVTLLFRSVPYTPIPRGAVATVARTTGDPMRRVRADKHADDPLSGILVLSAKSRNKVVEALGHPPLEPDHFMSVPHADIHALPHEVRRELGLDKQ